MHVWINIILVINVGGINILCTYFNNENQQWNIYAYSVLCELENNNKNTKCYQVHYIWTLILHDSCNISGTQIAEKPTNLKLKDDIVFQ